MKEIQMRSTNKGLTVKVNLWALEKYTDEMTARHARLWMRGQVTDADETKMGRVKKFNDAGELISILGKWNSEKFQELKKAKKNKKT